MAADLIVLVDPHKRVTDEVMRAARCNVMGSRYFNMEGDHCVIPIGQHLKVPGTNYTHDEAFWTLYHRDNIEVWLGEVSFLKAMLFGDNETYVPGPIERLSELLDGDEIYVLTPELLEEIVAALELPNTTNYNVARPEEVRAQLTPHLGQNIFSSVS
jgi:hypothetical protein